MSALPRKAFPRALKRFYDFLDGKLDTYDAALASPATEGSGAGTAAGTGVTAAEFGDDTIRKTVLTFVNVSVPLTDNAGVVAYGGLKVYDFPESLVVIQGAVADFALTKSSAGVIATFDGDVGVGTVTATSDATLATTEQNIIPTTSTPQAVAGVTTADAVSTAVTVLDGTVTPADVYVNLLVDDADHDVTGTPCNLILNGTLTLLWSSIGDK